MLSIYWLLPACTALLRAETSALGNCGVYRVPSFERRKVIARVIGRGIKAVNVDRTTSQPLRRDVVKLRVRPPRLFTKYVYVPHYLF